MFRFSSHILITLLYYDDSILLALAYVVGKLVKVDMNTLKITRVIFACVGVEVSLKLRASRWKSMHR